MAFQNYEAKNDAIGNLSGALGASGNFSIKSGGSAFPDGATRPFKVTIVQYSTPADPTSSVVKKEITNCSGRTGEDFTVSLRGAEGTTATTFNDGDWVYCNFTADTLDDVQQEVERLETDKANDSEVVKNTGNESIAGEKTFSGKVIVPAPVDNTDASTKKYVDDEIAAIPGLTGEIKMWATNSAPSGWLICDGSGLNTTTYANLFALIGYTFGGAGSTFNLPNLTGKVVVGRDSADTDFDTIGKTGGEKEHVLTESEIPPHTHTVDTNLNPGGITGSVCEGDSPSVTDAETSSTGGGAAHNNLQPYMALNYIIKT